MDKFKNTKKIYGILFCVVIFMWFLPGLFFNNKKDIKNVKNERNEPLISIEKIKIQDRMVNLYLTGTVDSRKNVEITSEVSGKITSVNVINGNFIKKGDSIAFIDVKDKQLRLEKAEVTLEQRQLEYESNKLLNKSDYTSDSVVSESLAAFKMAQADLKQAQLDLDNCNIVAPFDGIVDMIIVREGMLINNSTSIARVIKCGEYIVNSNIPEKEIHKLEIKNAEVKILGIDYSLKGNVNAISMHSEENTRSYKIEISIPELEQKCMNIIGKTADITLNLYKAKSFLVPSYALSLSDEGIIGIKVLDEENIVKFHRLEILEEDEDGHFWVKLDRATTEQLETINVITQGHKYVKHEQKVKTRI